MINVLFVCLGNICRSPAAEGIFIKLVKDNNLEHLIKVDSAGTSGYHTGQESDIRMRKTAARKGYKLLSRSRQFTVHDFRNFDFILAMDESNYSDILKLDLNNKFKDKVFLVTDFSTNYTGQDVPDPYYGGEEGFYTVIKILEESCIGFLDYLKLKL
ncbi:MAG: low molecular weight phosphotyrosine protein phosphatase [Spirochaetales bacterium]|nr:low molecular weight phosphotyrosine protein phosphatase [Spirochaetales bacterium]